MHLLDGCLFNVDVSSSLCALKLMFSFISGNSWKSRGARSGGQSGDFPSGQSEIVQRFLHPHMPRKVSESAWISHVMRLAELALTGKRGGGELHFQLDKSHMRFYVAVFFLPKFGKLQPILTRI